MALSNQRTLPLIIDLTLDSDFESGDDAVSLARPPVVFSNPPNRPSPRPSFAPEVVAPAMFNSASLPDSKRTFHTSPPARPIASRTPNTTNPSPKSRPVQASTTATMGRRASLSTGKTHAQAATTPTSNGKGHGEWGAKRRKLSIPSGKPSIAGCDHTQGLKHCGGKQANEHAATAFTPARASSAVIAATSLGAQSNSMNGTPSVQFMNSALKPSASPIPVLDTMPTRAARPLFVGRTPHGKAGIESPTPRSTPLESNSAIVIDSDPLEPVDAEAAHLQPPTVLESKRRGGTGRSSSRQDMSPESVSPAIAPTIAAQAQFSPRRSSLSGPAPAIETIEREDELSMADAFSEQAAMRDELRQNRTPRELQQRHLPTQQRTPSLPPMTALVNPPSKTDTRSDTEKADHLLIFLKEVKRLKWSEITEEFCKDIPGRSYSNLQSRYSTTLNKRDRTQDPPKLDLPPRFRHEATVDWADVHANTQGPRPRKLMADSGSSDVDWSKAVPRAVQHIRDGYSSSADSSGSGSVPQRQRARRAALVNYTLPEFREVEGGLEELPSLEEPTSGHRTTSRVHSRSGTPGGDSFVVSRRASTVRSQRLNPYYSRQDAKLGLTLSRGLRNAQQDRVPYLSVSQRLAMHDSSKGWTWDPSSMEWQGTLLHADFSPTELQIVENVVMEVISSGRQSRHSTCRRRLRGALRGHLEPKLRRLAHEIGRQLRSRDADSILSFLADAAAGKISDSPHIQRLATVELKFNLSSTQSITTSSCVRQRELGFQSRRGRQTASRALTYRLTNQLTDTLGPKSTWTGASSDIHTVAWSPDGHYFAAGAVAVTDTDSMQYNRPNVLLYGDIMNGNIHELAAHCIKRPKTDAGANSTHAMYVSQDPKLFTTVSSVAFSQSSNLMYSAGYDHSVCIWDVSAGSRQPYLIRKLAHTAPVDILAVNPTVPGVIATATQRTTDKSIRLFKFSEQDIFSNPWHHTDSSFASQRAVNRPDLKMSANALKFDPTGRFLLAGFGANLHEGGGLDTSGDICLWDVESGADLDVYGSSRNVFDVTFNARSRQGLFAVGCVANGNVSKGIRSIVRFYSQKEDHRYTCPLELDCKALDMNDVVWCPYDDNLFAVGCTDGRSYLWDLRRVDRPLYILEHGDSLMPLQDGVHHEKTDTGVRFLSWGQNARRLYSGSSDGVVKVWDVMQSNEDVLIKDLITTKSGIMSGAFSPDYSKLVLGEVNGTANVLEVGRDDFVIEDADRLSYHPYTGSRDEEATDTVIDTLQLTGTAAAGAREWLQTQQLQLAPMAGLPKKQVIQGPNYAGPFDRCEDSYTQSLREEAFQMQQTMALATGPQCNLVGCADINTTTYEDIGDSGRSLDRIPDSLRQQWLDETPRSVPGRWKCTRCSRPAMPSLSDDDALCERHAFTCFRCGGRCSVARSEVECTFCGGIWNMGALGYECTRQPTRSGGLDVPKLEQWGKAAYLERLADVDAGFGGEMNALTEYYLGLGVERDE